jgi:hypothetical protein
MRLRRDRIEETGEGEDSNVTIHAPGASHYAVELKNTLAFFARCGKRRARTEICAKPD